MFHSSFKFRSSFKCEIKKQVNMAKIILVDRNVGVGKTQLLT